MDSYKRFHDEDYKHWLQAAESLYILRSHLRDFVENETEKYHRSLQEKLKDEICTSKCSLHKAPKKFSACEKCEQWKDVILLNHKNKGGIHWNNCQPYLWPTDKWEVAKVYMLRGVKDHHSFDQFDISAILNFMHHCKHFKNFTDGQYITKVINVRNKVMHSPDFRLSKKEMDDSIKNIEQLATILQNYAPGLQNISKDIQQFNSFLEQCSERVSQSTADKKEEILKLLDREQHALKEKIEFLAQCYEEDQTTELKKELQGMKSFLDQNKDLLENLGPQVSQLNEIQEKVNQHDQDINTLYNRVDQLVNDASDPMFSGDPLKFKNHLFEVAQKRGMPEPEFTEECEASGYRGIVNVNGRTFTGSQVCNSKKNAHQEVAKIALEYMKAHPEWEGERTETTSSISSTTASSSTIYYGIVAVVLNNKEIVSDWCVQEEEAIESAYNKLACQFGLTSPEAGNTFRTAVLEYFQKCNFPVPKELSVRQDNKALCKLQINGLFNFYDKDGSSKKKQAEQQAAKVALQHLSGLFNYSFKTKSDKTYKSFLKELLESLGLKQPDYNFTKNREGTAEVLEDPTSCEDNSQLEMSKNEVKETLNSSPSEMLSQAPKLDSTGTIYYGIVTVFLNNQEIVSDGCLQEEEATESAYRRLAYQFGLTSLEGKTAVLEHFQRCNFPTPQELSVWKDAKIFCKLQLTGPFTFFDNDGSSKKKQAEQQAAKVALRHLSGFFNYSFETKADKTYKSFLKEQLDALHLKNPVYTFKEKKRISEELESPSTSGDNSCCEFQDASTPDIPNKSHKLDNPAIDTLLALFHLKPPSVTVEHVSREMIFSCHVDINLDKFTFQNNNDYTAKKDAIRKTYLLLGSALGISKQKLDENNASMLVKQDFSQKSLTLPKEVFENKKCSLNDITYKLFYDGKGSSEAEAKQDALKKALDTLTLLCGFKSLPKCSKVDETEVQVNNLLRMKDQKEFIYSHEHNLYKSSVELLFQDYTMASKHEKRKNENLNHLSRRILGLLAVEPESNTVSIRNCLDDWFKQKNLKQPVFENTEEAHGSKVTFSVKVSCSNPNWEDSMEVAEEKLVDELRERLKYLSD